MADLDNTPAPIGLASPDRVSGFKDALERWRTRYTVIDGELVRTPEAQAEIDAWLIEREADIAREQELILEARRAPLGYVDLYFIGGDTGPIKIGVSGNPAQRLKALQTGYPHALRILALIPEGGMQEITYHAKFAEHRLHGEWFAPHPDILAEIERLNTGANQ